MPGDVSQSTSGPAGKLWDEARAALGAAVVQSTLDYLVDLMRRWAFNFTDEDALQAGIAEMLTREGIVFVREYELSPFGRIDFYLTDARVGIEVKVKGSPSAVIGQLHGYARHADVEGLLLVTAKSRLGRVPETMNGKPLGVVGLWAGML